MELYHVGLLFVIVFLLLLLAAEHMLLYSIPCAQSTRRPVTQVMDRRIIRPYFV